MRPAVAIAFCLMMLVTGTARAGKGVDGVVNLNTAPAGVLALLPGVGPAKAAAIVGYRTRRPFRTVDELVRIKGIGHKMVRRLRPHLAVAGPTTATGAAIAGTTATAPPAATPAPRGHPPPAARCPPGAAAPPRRPRGESRDPTPRRLFGSACRGAP